MQSSQIQKLPNKDRGICFTVDPCSKLIRVKSRLDPLTQYGLKLEIGNWEEQYKSMKAKFPISTFRERSQNKVIFIYDGNQEIIFG